MLFNGPRVHLSRQELNRLRQANARNGHVVNHVGTRDDLIEAIVHGLPESIQRDLHRFLENPEAQANATAHSPCRAVPRNARD